jgi:mRNA interferase YafQ
VLEIVQSSRFKRDIKKARKQGKPLAELQTAIKIIVQQKPLPKKFRDHNLGGDYANFRECHIRPDWLLIYKITERELQLARVGSHSELF